MAKIKTSQKIRLGSQQTIMSFACPPDLAEAIADFKSKLDEPVTLSHCLVVLLRQKLNCPDRRSQAEFLRG